MSASPYVGLMPTPPRRPGTSANRPASPSPSPPTSPFLGIRRARDDEPDDDQNIDPQLREPYQTPYQTPGWGTAPPPKRARLDHSAFVQSQGISLKLSEQDVTKLQAFSKKTEEEQRIAIYGSVLRIDALLTAVDVSKSWTIHAELQANLNNRGSAILLCPVVWAYKDDRLHLPVINYLTALGRHLPNKRNHHEYKSFLSAIAEFFVTERGRIKRLIKDSLDRYHKQQEPEYIRRKRGSDSPDLYSLCLAIVNRQSFTISFRMMARVAFLRKELDSNPGNKDYWEKVDRELRNIRDAAKAGRTLQERILEAETRVFHALYDEDIKKYGAVDHHEGQIAAAGIMTEEEREVEGALQQAFGG